AGAGRPRGPVPPPRRRNRPCRSRGGDPLAGTAVKRTAIVTLTMSARHRALWGAHCRDNWEDYAAPHGYDVICIDRPLDRSDRARRRSPTWQKCLILGQPFAERYERIVWMDSDVLINPAAPSIVDGVPLDRVGAVDEYATPTEELYRQS